MKYNLIDTKPDYTHCATGELSGKFDIGYFNKQWDIPLVDVKESSSGRNS